MRTSAKASQYTGPFLTIHNARPVQSGRALDPKMPRIIIHLPEEDRLALALYLAMNPEDRAGHPLMVTELSKMDTTKSGTMVLRMGEPKQKLTQMALPLPPPSPAVGQVWVWLGWPGGRGASSIRGGSTPRCDRRGAWGFATAHP